MQRVCKVLRFQVHGKGSDCADPAPFLCRKLIEGEDSRLSGMVQGMSLISRDLGAMGRGLGYQEAGASYCKGQAVELTERKTMLIR